MYFLFQEIGDCFVAFLIRKRNDDIKDDIGMGRAFDQTEVVEEDFRIGIFQQVGDGLPQMVCLFVVGDDRIHMDDGIALKFVVKAVFDVVDHIMEYEEAAVCRDFGMEGDHDTARAVIVDDHIVDSLDMLIAHNDPFHIFDKIRVGRLAEQRADGVFGGAVSGVKNEQAHKDAAVSVDIKPGEMGCDRGDQDDGGSHGIAQTVGSGSVHGGAVYFFADAVIVICHVKFDSDGNEQDCDRKDTEFDGFRADNFIEGSTYQLESHNKDGGGNKKSGQILDPAMPERMVGIRFLAGHLKAYQSNQGRTGIGQVVESICGDRDGTAGQARQELSGKQQDIQADAHAAAKNPVSFAHFWRRCVVSIFNQYFCK